MNHPHSIFISYRRADAAGYVRALMSNLQIAFGNHQVFLDMETIEAGHDFANAIKEAISQCEIVLAVVGPHWLTIENEIGQIRLFETDDFIRLEISTALKCGIPVIPVLVDNAKMPRMESLPQELLEFSNLQAIALTHERWDNDISKLLAAIDNLTVAPRMAREFEQAEGKLSKGHWLEALHEFEALEKLRPGYRNIPELITPLQDLAIELFDSGAESSRCHRLALRFPFTVLVTATLIPHILAAIFNFIFNWHVIVEPMQSRGIQQAEELFRSYAIVVNSVLFTLGLSILVFLLNPILGAIHVENSKESLLKNPQRLIDLRQRCLTLGYRVAMTGLGLWLVAGPIYPILVGALEFRDYVLFISSLAISGTLVAVYPFFLVTWLCTWIYYRPLMHPGTSLDADHATLDWLINKKWIFLLLSAAIPLLVISLGFALGHIHKTPPLVGILLSVVGLTGLCGFLLTILVFKSIQKNLKTWRLWLWACSVKSHYRQMQRN